MASSKEYLQFILEQLSVLDGVSSRAMMGDNRLLVKPVQAARSYLPRIRYETPYEGAKEMLLVEEVEEPEFLVGLFRAVYEELPAPKKKARQQ